VTKWFYGKAIENARGKQSNKIVQDNRGQVTIRGVIENSSNKYCCENECGKIFS
jgi:hypothetical protein